MPESENNLLFCTTVSEFIVFSSPTEYPRWVQLHIRTAISCFATCKEFTTHHNILYASLLFRTDCNHGFINIHMGCNLILYESHIIRWCAFTKHSFCTSNTIYKTGARILWRNVWKIFGDKSWSKDRFIISCLFRSLWNMTSVRPGLDCHISLIIYDVTLW